MNGTDAPFRDIPNGIPGLATRLPLLWTLGVGAGRIGACDFVRLVATRPAQIFGLANKGHLMPGADADIVLWDPARRVTITAALLQQAIELHAVRGHGRDRLAGDDDPGPGRWRWRTASSRPR